MKIQVQPGAVQGRETRISVNSEYLDNVELQNVVPEPDSVESGSDRLTYVFKLANAGDRATIRFDIMPVQYGLHEIQVALEGGPEHRLNQFIYP